jgi:glycosyltransferase involved in cell wall biosynthesis
MDKKNILRVGYVSPGWPPKNFPNGIVTYIQNIIYKQEDKINAIILTYDLIEVTPNSNLINLSSIINKRSVFERIFDKVINSITLNSFVPIRYKRGMEYRSNKIINALNQLKEPLNILEIEESFGVSHFLVNKTNMPIVTRIHGPWFIHGPIMEMDSMEDYHLRVYYEGEAIKNSHGVTAPCLDVLERVRNYYGIALPNAKVIPNPVLEIPHYKQWQYNTAGKPYILVVARFDLHKGGDLAVDAFRYIAQKIDDIELFFVGPDRGLNIEGKELKFNEYIQRFVPEENIKTRIKFFGQCDQEKISALRKDSLVTMVCSRYENFPLSLLEALSYGCPTVATAVGGMKEIITDGYNGLLANSESPEDIAHKVLALINNPKRMKELSKNAVEDCVKRFSPDVVAAQSLEFYQSVIVDKKPT